MTKGKSLCSFQSLDRSRVHLYCSPASVFDSNSSHSIVTFVIA